MQTNSGSSCIGTDLNRNWDDHWGGGGSSSNPCSDIFRGAGPFSAPETKAVADYLMDVIRPQTNLVAAIDFHAYGQLILRPYGWTLPTGGNVPENDAEMRALGDGMRDVIQRAGYNTRYTSEHSAELYVAAGGADDWFYSAATGRGIAYTFELRDTGRYGFVLPASQINPTGEETMAAMRLFLSTMAGRTLN